LSGLDPSATAVGGGWESEGRGEEEEVEKEGVERLE
jgi:hypothetical protein